MSTIILYLVSLQVLHCAFYARLSLKLYEITTQSFFSNYGNYFRVILVSLMYEDPNGDMP